MKRESKVLQVWGKEEDKEFKVGEIIGTTTAEFEYNSIDCCFENNLERLGTVRAVLVDSDYSEYESKNSCNGGAYGFDFWKITEVIERKE